ncbi:MAG: PIN domain-containing protein [Thermoanaerobaculia bacterium]
MKPLIYLDTSVALAHLFVEDRQPGADLWRNSLVTSRLLEYELWIRLHARGLTESHGDAARQLLSRLAFIELAPAVLARALEPFPVAVRTLDALHLASVDFLRSSKQTVVLATYDTRMADAARALGFALHDPDGGAA